MKRRTAGLSVRQLLVRLNFRPPTGLWNIPCRDHHGHRAHVLVRLTLNTVEIHTPPGNKASLTPLQVGQFPAALRDAVIHHATLATPKQ